MTSRIRFVGCLVLLGGLGCATGCRKQAAAPTAPRPVETVAAVPASTVELPASVYAGVFRAETTLQVTFPKPGRVVRIGPNEGAKWKTGDRVPRGAILAAVESTTEVAQMAAAEARLADAKAQHERDAALHGSGSITRQQLDASAQERRAAEVALAHARAALADLEVRAPFEGIVQRRGATLGEHVPVGSVVLIVDDVATIRFEAQLPSHVSAHLRGDESAVLLVDGRRLDARLDGTPFLAQPGDALFMVRFKAPLPPSIRPGASGRIEFNSRSVVSGLVAVPASALVFVRKDGRASPSVLLVDHAGNLIRREVELGDSLGDRVTLTGVAAGEHVVVRAGGDLFVGMPVQQLKR